MAKKLKKRAQRDVNFAFRPEKQALQRAEDRGRDDYEQADARVNDIYGALQRELKPLGGQYDQAYQGIVGDLTGQLGNLQGMLGTSPGAPGEAAAASGAFGAIGAGGFQGLASDRLRNASYQTSTQRQAGLERATLRKNYLEDFRDFIDDIRERGLDLQGDKSQALMIRLDELRDQRRQTSLQNRELDIAEDQFGKTFGLQKKGFQSEQKANKAATKFAQGQVEAEMDRKRIQPIRKDVSRLKAQRGDMRSELRGLVGSTDPAGLNATTRDEELLKGIRRKSKRIQKKKKRIRKIKRS